MLALQITGGESAINLFYSRRAITILEPWIPRHQGLTLPVAEVLVPHLGNVEHLGDGRVRLLGYSPYDLYEGPSSVFKLFELCDGVRPWRDVLAALSPQYPELTEAEVVALARFRLLAPAPPAAAESVAESR